METLGLQVDDGLERRWDAASLPPRHGRRLRGEPLIALGIHTCIRMLRGLL